MKSKAKFLSKDAYDEDDEDLDDLEQFDDLIEEERDYE